MQKLIKKNIIQESICNAKKNDCEKIQIEFLVNLVSINIKLINCSNIRNNKILKKKTRKTGKAQIPSN